MLRFIPLSYVSNVFSQQLSTVIISPFHVKEKAEEVVLGEGTSSSSGRKLEFPEKKARVSIARQQVAMKMRIHQRLYSPQEKIQKKEKQ